MRGFLKKYREQENKGHRQNNKVPTLKRGRPLMIGSIDARVQKYILAVRSKGGHISRSTTVVTANVLLAESTDPSLQGIVVNDTWGQSLLRRMGFTRRTATTGKMQITDDAKKEMAFQYHYKIVTHREEYNIPDSLILNSDQTPSKYVTVVRTTMAPKNVKHVAVAGLNDRRAITLTLTISLDGKMLPFQAIYGGKTKQSLPKIKFPDGFSLSVNKKLTAIKRKSSNILMRS